MKLNKHLWLKVLGLIGLSTITINPSPSSALILFEQSTGLTQVKNFWNDSSYTPIRSNTSILGFNEAQDVVLPRDIGVQEKPSTLANEWDDLILNQIIAAGTKVSSHMIYLARNAGTDPLRIDLTADIVFDGIILGFVGDFCLFDGGRPSVSCPVRNDDNDLFAPNQPITNLGEGTRQSLEQTGGVLPPDNVQMLTSTSIRIAFSQQSGTDPLRVYTLSPTDPSAVPFEFSPNLGIGILMGLGGVQYLYRKFKK